MTMLCDCGEDRTKGIYRAGCKRCLARDLARSPRNIVEDQLAHFKATRDPEWYRELVALLFEEYGADHPKAAP